MGSAAYYNEFDPFAAAWLRELIKADLIAPGEVDERSIEDVFPDDLKGFVQCHFFAGIGVWSLALRLAGWEDNREIWTGSCPCQPFSAAGKGARFDDERHLWPAFHWLITNGKPDAVPVVGEQVASKDGLDWLDLVSADMEGSGYALGALDTCAAGFSAPHIRQRSYWLAAEGVAIPDGMGDAFGARLEGWWQSGRGRPDQFPVGEAGLVVRLDDASGARTGRGAGATPCPQGGGEGTRVANGDEGYNSPVVVGDASGLAHALPTGRTERGTEPRARPASGLRPARRLADAECSGERGRGLCGSGEGGRGISGSGKSNSASSGAACERSAGLCPDGRLAHADGDRQSGRPERNSCSKKSGEQASRGDDAGRRGELCDRVSLHPLNYWRDAEWLLCRDPDGPRFRPVEPGSFPLVDAGELRNRLATVRGAGNALNLAQAQGFIEAVMECMP